MVKFKILKEKLMKELYNTDFSQIYEDTDILTCIDEYNQIRDLIDNSTINEVDKVIYTKTLIQIEEECLRKNRLIKLKGDKNYYAYKNEAYDNSGSLIDYSYNDYLQEGDLFCEYNMDKIYKTMIKNINKKIIKEKKEDFNRI